MLGSQECKLPEKSLVGQLGSVAGVLEDSNAFDAKADVCYVFDAIDRTVNVKVMLRWHDDG